MQDVWIADDGRTPRGVRNPSVEASRGACAAHFPLRCYSPFGVVMWATIATRMRRPHCNH
jgi:hypothetical protein